MFPLIAKLLTPLVSPMGLAALLWLMAGIAHFVYPRWSARLLWTGFSLLLFFSTSCTGAALLSHLEGRYPAMRAEDSPSADVIIVLGGATVPALKPRVHIEVADSYDRLLHGMRLFRAGKAPHLLLSGGNLIELTGVDQSEAQQYRTLALESGIPDSVLVLEERSRNTRENALYTAQTMRERGWKNALLVTSASHMPRAAAAFSALDVSFVAAPTDVNCVDGAFSLWGLLPSAYGLEQSSVAIKEYVGWCVYALRGWID